MGISGRVPRLQDAEVDPVLVAIATGMRDVVASTGDDLRVPRVVVLVQGELGGVSGRLRVLTPEELLLFLGVVVAVAVAGPVEDLQPAGFLFHRREGGLTEPSAPGVVPASRHAASTPPMPRATPE